MDPSERKRRGQRAAGRQLRTLLLQVRPYRDRWEGVAERAIATDEVNQAAVCEVIAQWLYDDGHPDTDTELNRRLKDKVSRALSGDVLTPRTLEWFIEAFRLSPHDAARVRGLHRGGIELREIVGSLAPPAPGSARSPGHRTTLLFEHHYIGRDGLPAHHHTQQTIYSLTDGLARYLVRIDTDEAEVRVRRGGTAGKPYPLGSGLLGIDITFPHPLGFGEAHYLDYWTNMHYSQPPAREFRRAAHQRVEHVDMRVEFHRDKLPSRIWWAEWSGYLDGDVVERTEVTLDEERSAHRYLDAIENTVVGFHWDWLKAVRRFAHSTPLWVPGLQQLLTVISSLQNGAK